MPIKNIFMPPCHGRVLKAMPANPKATPSALCLVGLSSGKKSAAPKKVKMGIEPLNNLAILLGNNAVPAINLALPFIRQSELHRHQRVCSDP